MLAVLRACRQLLPRGALRLAAALILSVLSAMLQGISIGLLLPLLEIIQGAQGGRSGLVWRALNGVYGALNVPVTLATLLAGMMAMIAGAQAFLYFQRRTVAALSEGLVVAVRSGAFDDILRSDYAYQRAVPAGTFFNVLTQESVRSGGALEGVLDAATRAVLLGFYVAILVAISWQTSLAGMVIVALASLIVQYQMRSSRRLGERFSAMNEQLYGYVRERMTALHLIRLLTAEEEERRSFSRLSADVASVRRKVVARGGEVRLIMEPVVAGAGLAAIYLGLRVFRISLAELAVFLYVLVRILPEAYGMNSARFFAKNMLPSYANVEDIRRQARNHTTIIPGPRLCEGVRGSIEFADVRFGYQPAALTFHNLTLRLPADQFTAIVGPSGSGKSTLLSLIVRLIDPDGGRVLLDGVDLREFDTASLRREIALVTQDVVLFNDTVFENIRHGLAHADYETVVEAAVQANAHGFITALPHGYETVIGPMGLTLSGGERQRIALARALVRRPSVLLLDEVTSGLDAESDRLLQESVFRAAYGRTVVAVSHRLSTIRHAHNVVVIDGGRVLEQGTPAALRNGEGLFRRYLDLQTGGGSRAE